MPKKTKKQLNEEFLEKLKTLTVSTGSKSIDPTCANCGNPLSKHALIPVAAIQIPFPFPLPGRRPKPESKHNEETAFAA
jgi:hypothetical protein